MFLTLVGPYRAFDHRYRSTALSLNSSELRFLLRVKWPLLKGPLASAAAIGFAVSMAQYVSVQLVGAGNTPTLTTEAVTLASGGNRAVLAAFALALAALTAAAFAAAAWIGGRVPLELQQVALRLGGQTLIQAFDLAIARSEIVTLMGPSGSGKSSLLSFVAGDLAPPLTGHGQVRLGGKDISTAAPAQRHIGRLFQDDLLFPHMSVGENLLFGVPRGERRAREQKMRASLAEVDLVGFEHRSPASLSGGQRQRVA